ncbi:zinc-binding alcohol dehydrogenase family protein [uncultured Mucilaginibacter sp.]|uniref:zinc-binding alcohol dehydrogenase family protein n=1 Tax=uncultured Mucilaginibacter sp. TaxID=797541 RepID=UPI0025DB02A7|nr:zinc-binding alcohol dehydrogenase family protein [uncultured Mucilaginibacter sp.]
MNKALSCEQPGHFEYKVLPLPKKARGYATIKIKSIGICGTDLHAYEGTQPYFDYPRILGHELSGTLIDVDGNPDFVGGERVTFIPYFNCGTCVACRNNKPNCCVNIKVCGVHQDGGMIEYLQVPSYSLIHGSDLTFDELALVEPLAIGAHAVRRAAIVKNEFVLVVGAGPIGLGIMEFARIAGARVIAMDINADRLSFCKQRLNIPYAINAKDDDADKMLREITGGEYPTVVIDATGSRAAINNGFNYLAHGGRYVLVGLQKGDINVSHPEFHKREATLMSSRNATRQDFEVVMNAMKNKLVNPANYITHKTTFAKLKDDFPNWLNPASGVIKAMVEM